MPSKNPKRLHNDAIIEALCEIRFNSKEVPEIIVGRLTDHWSSLETVRLSSSDIPQPIREQDPRLRYAATLELRDPNGEYLIRIGSNAISFHNTGNYLGWDKLSKKLEETISGLFDKVPSISVNRIGFRYTNAISDKHLISQITALDYEFKIAGKTVSGPVNLNVLEQCDDNHYTMTRISSLEFVEGQLAANVNSIIDIDVYTPPTFSTSSISEVLKWINDAHTYEGTAFFRLIPVELLDKLVAEWE